MEDKKTPPVHKNQTLRLTVESLSSDGNGVARVNGMALFIPGAAVGDVLDVQVVKLKNTYGYAVIRQLVTPGAGRVKPDCPIAGRCGGCVFRHLSYETELAAKHTMMADALSRIAGLNTDVLPVLPSPQVDRYRNKVQYPVAPSSSGGFCYGFYAARSHRVVPSYDCLLQPTILNQLAARTADTLVGAGVSAYNEETHKGQLRHIFLRHSHANDDILLCLVLGAPLKPHQAEALTGLTAGFSQLKGIVLNHNTKNTNVILGPRTELLWGQDAIEDSLCGVPVRLDIYSFAQVNTGAAEQLFSLVTKLAAPTKDDTLLDIYCGTGVIGLSMAAQCGRLIGVEVVPQAIEAARAAAGAMGLTNTRFLAMDASKAAAQLAAENTKIDIATVDPPRKGMDANTIDSLLAMAPRRIVMVSCNPATLARDLALLAQGGYTVQTVQPADLFPRTRHVECAVLLTKGINP